MGDGLTVKVFKHHLGNNELLVFPTLRNYDFKMGN